MSKNSNTNYNNINLQKNLLKFLLMIKISYANLAKNTFLKDYIQHLIMLGKFLIFQYLNLNFRINNLV